MSAQAGPFIHNFPDKKRINKNGLIYVCVNTSCDKLVIRRNSTRCACGAILRTPCAKCNDKLYSIKTRHTHADDTETAEKIISQTEAKKKTTTTTTTTTEETEKKQEKNVSSSSGEPCDPREQVWSVHSAKKMLFLWRNPETLAQADIFLNFDRDDEHPCVTCGATDKASCSVWCGKCDQRWHNACLPEGWIPPRGHDFFCPPCCQDGNDDDGDDDGDGKRRVKIMSIQRMVSFLPVFIREYEKAKREQNLRRANGIPENPMHTFK